MEHSRCIGVQVDDARHAAVIRPLQLCAGAQRVFLQARVRPHGNVVVNLSLTAFGGSRFRQVQHFPYRLDPRADTHHDIVGLNFTLIRDHCGNSIPGAAKSHDSHIA